MKAIKKLSKGTIILFVLAAAITGFTSLKTIDLLRFTMPPDQAPFAWFGWACFEGGLAAWIYWSSAGARRDQRSIASLMVWFNLIAVIVAFFADTILVVARKGGVIVDNNILTWIVIIAVGIVVTANLLAVVGTHQADPDMQKRIRQEEYQEAIEEVEENANHKIEIARLKHIANNADKIAPQIGFQKGQEWMQDAYERWAHGGQHPALPQSKEVTGKLEVPKLETNVLDVMSSEAVDSGKMIDLINMAVRYKQMTQEEATPLLQALAIQAKSQSNGATH